MSVVTLPLKTEKWQEDLLEKRFECYRDVYNVLLGVMKKELGKLQHDPKYIESKAVILSAYNKDLSEKEKKEIKRSEEYKKAQKIQQEMLREKGFSEFGLEKKAKYYYKYYDMHIPSSTVGKSITQPMWAAFEKLLYGNGKKVSFKKKGNFNRIASGAKSGIRIVDDDGKTRFSGNGCDKLYVLFGTRGNKLLKMPIVVPKGDDYKKRMLCHTWKVVSIIRKKVGSRYRYYCQLTVEGAPEERFNQETGEILHPVGKGKLGVYIDTKYVTICTEDEKFHTFDLSFNQSHEEEIAKLLRYMDLSRRIMNPDNFNADGTIKKGISENGKKKKLRWNNSKGYFRAKDEVANLYRKDAETRKIQRQILANKIISYGNNIVINDYPFQYAAMRKKDDELTSSGKPASKKKAGKAIGTNSPATVVNLIDSKLVSKGYPGVTKVKLKDIDTKTEGYRKYYAKLLMEMAE